MSPINFLSDRHRAQRLGRVRLGIKVFKCPNPKCTKEIKDTGEFSIVCPHCGRVDNVITSRRSYPRAVPYFVLNDAPTLKQFYEEQPTSLNIEFLWDNVELTFPHYMRRYTAKGLRCLGDGQSVLYRVSEEGNVDVRDGNAVLPNGKVVMSEGQPVKVACEGETCPHYENYEDGSCKPTGYLRFLPIEAPRLGYYDLVCHQRAVVGILTQLKLTLGIFHHLTGIPFILHRGEEEKVPVKVPGKGMVDMPIRTQWIEIEPGWFAENWAHKDEHRALAAAKVRQDMIELFGEDSNGDSLLPAPAMQEMAEPAFEGEGTSLIVPEGEWVHAEAKVEYHEEVGEEQATPVVEKEKPSRPFPPETVCYWLDKANERHAKATQVSDGQVGLMVGMLNKILGGDLERKSWLKYTWGVDSSKDTLPSQVLATLDWLKAEKDPETGEWVPHPFAVSEARMMLREAMVDAGQQELGLED